MGFKGTKGKWIKMFEEVETLNGRMICDTYSTTEEDNYNALLISKAPEMLEMLDEIICSFEGDNLHGYQEEIIEQAKQLIKQATEL